MQRTTTLLKFATMFEGKQTIPSFVFVGGLDDGALMDNIRTIETRRNPSGRRDGTVVITQGASMHVGVFSGDQEVTFKKGK